MEEQTNNEPKYRINIKQTAKGVSYYDVTVKGDTKEELNQRLNEIIEIARVKCNKLNECVK